MKNSISIFLFFLSLFCFGQQIQLLNSQKSKVSFRGLSVVNDSTIWVSGSEGTIGLSTDSGKTFEWVSPEGFSKRDFRAIAGFDTQTAIAIAVGSPAVIIKTTDGGRNWTEVYRDEHPDVFLDDMSFYSENLKIGIAVGDPIQGDAYFLKTIDGGDSWKKIDQSLLPDLDDGEAFFAASNSNLKLIDEDTFFAVSGGATSDLIFSGENHYKIGLSKTDSSTSGANGLDFSQGYGLIVGGDFMNPKASANNLFIFELTIDGIPLIKKPDKSPTGYQSGVAILDDGKAISCGMLNVEFSKDKGRNWETISKKGYHTCKKARNGNRVFLAGAGGRIAVLID